MILHRSGWAVVSLPRYPGWKAWVNGLPSETASAYGFLTAVRVPAGKSVVDLEYRPRSFAAGWLCFLMAVWVWLVLFGLAGLRAARPAGRATPKRFLIAATSGALPLCGVAAGLWAGPLDSLLMRVAELSALAALALLAARWAGGGRRQSGFRAWMIISAFQMVLYPSTIRPIERSLASSFSRV